MAGAAVTRNEEAGNRQVDGVAHKNNATAVLQSRSRSVKKKYTPGPALCRRNLTSATAFDRSTLRRGSGHSHLPPLCAKVQA